MQQSGFIIFVLLQLNRYQLQGKHAFEFAGEMKMVSEFVCSSNYLKSDYQKEVFIFVGTIQIQKRQQLVTKTRELKDMKDDLYQCQQVPGDKVGVRMSLAGSHWVILSLCV